MARLFSTLPLPLLPVCDSRGSPRADIAEANMGLLADDDDDYDDIYVMMKCMCVCHEKWSLSPWSLLQPPVTTRNHPVSSRLIFHGSGWVFMVPGWFSWFFTVPGQFSWFFMVPGRFLMVFHGSRLVFYGFRSVFMVFHGSRLVFSWL